MEINPLDIAIHIVNIVVLYLILSTLVYHPVKKFMDARTKRVADEMDRATKAKEEADKTIATYNALMAKADEEAKNKLNRAAEEGNAEAQRILAEAKEEAAKIVAEGKVKAKEEADSRLAAAKEQILDLSVDIAKTILAREVSENDNAHLIDSFFNSDTQN